MKLWPDLGGPLLTVGALVTLELLSGSALWIPNPPAVLLLTTVYSAFSGGRRAGLISASITCVYLAYFFSVPGQPFRYTDENLRRAVVWFVTIPLMALMLISMRRRTDHAMDEILRRERDHSASLAASLAERTRAEASLRALFERNLAGIFRSRHDGRILECNAAIVHLLGFASREELLARNAKEFYADPADRERLMKLLQPGVIVSNHELQWRRADGALIWVVVNVRAVVEGPSVYLEGIVLDITDRKRAEAGGRATRA
ncbi:MAG: PAS domain S-box protein [Candidatus Rokuibacteriota bacterium]